MKLILIKTTSRTLLSKLGFDNKVLEETKMVRNVVPCDLTDVLGKNNSGLINENDKENCYNQNKTTDAKENARQIVSK